MLIPLYDTFVRASVRKRLWLGAGAVSVFIGTLAVALFLMPTDPHDQGKVGLDFIAFYTAGSFVREGKSHDLYDIRKVHHFQYELARKNGVDLGNAVGPWWNPPFYAWVFVPLSRLPYRDAMKAWMLLNVLCAGISAMILCRIVARAANPNPDLEKGFWRPMRRERIVKGAASNFIGRCLVPTPIYATEKLRRSAQSATDSSLQLRTTDSSPQRSSFSKTSPTCLPGGWRTWLLVPVLMVLSTPFIHALSHGQNTCTSLLLVTVLVAFWRSERAVLAGLVAGLLFYKPQLAAVLAAVLILDLGWKSLVGLSITGIILLLASLTLPGSLHDFLHQMPRNIHFVQCDVPYLWDRHVTFKAFWRLLLQGSRAGEPTKVVTCLALLSSASVGAGLLWATLKMRKVARPKTLRDAESRRDLGARRDRLIAATIAATPLLMPFYFDYDQLLLAVPAVLLAADLIRRKQLNSSSRCDVWLMRIWPIQYVWLMLNPDIAALTHLNVGVLLLTAIVTLLIVRAGQNRANVNVMMTHDSNPRMAA